MILTFTVLYLLLNVAIGFWAARRVNNAADFAVAGRGLSVLVASTSIFATWFGAETVMSSSGLFAKEGFGAVIRDPFGAAVCLILMGLLLAKVLYKLNVVTFSDYFRMRYGRSAELISAGLMSYSYFSWIAGQLAAMGKIIQSMAAQYDWNVPVAAGIFVGAAIIALYTCVGGMWAVSLTDFMQAAVILAGLIFLMGSLLYATGGLSPVIAAQPEGFFSFAPKPEDPAVGTTIMDWLMFLAAWMTIGVSFAQQDVLQRIMSTKNANDARKASVYAGLMYVGIAMLPLGIGLCGYYLYPELINAAGEENAHEGLILRVVTTHSGLWLQILFFGALTSAIMSTASGAILSPATMITENLIRPFFPHFSDKKMLFVLRASVVIVTVVSAALAMGGKSIYELNADASTILLVTFTAPIVLGLYWKRTSLAGGLSAMLAGFVGWYLIGWIGSAYSWSDGHTAALSLFGGLGASIAAAVLVSLIFPNTQPEPTPQAAELGEE